MAGIEIKGLDKLFAKLDRVAATATLDPPMQRAVLRLEAYMKVYPPAPSGSRYIRGYGMKGGKRTSEKYGQRWTHKVDPAPGGGLIGRVGNNASYGPLVGSAKFQAKIHKRTGWRTDEQAVKDNEAAIVADFQAAIDKALQG